MIIHNSQYTIHNSNNSFNRIRVCLFIVFIVFLLSDTAWAIDDSKSIIYDTLEKLKKKYEETKREFEEGRKKLGKKEQEKQNILKELKNSDREIENLHRNLQKIRNEVNRLNKEIRAAQQRHDKADQAIKTHSEEYAQRLRSMYKRQRISVLEMFFSAGSVSSMLRGLKMFSVMARNDVKVLKSIRSQKRAIENSLKTITAALNAQRALAKSKNSQELSLGKTQNRRQKLLEEIKQDEELLKASILQKQKDMERGWAEIEKLRGSIAREVKKREFLDDVSDDIKMYNFAGRKGKLPWPVAGKVVSSFGVITDPKTKTKTRNRGVEIETSRHEPICAIASGVVMITQFIRGYGNLVIIYHPPNYYTIYAHLSDFLVNRGMEIREGEIIGLAGTTGLIDISKARLLLEVLNGKNPENPLSWLKPDIQGTRS